MKLSLSKSARWFARAGIGSRRGFALIVTLSLMILLTVVAVGLLSLSSITLRESGSSRSVAAARANAKLALAIALGELQSKLGPDQRVSATADILPTTDPTKKYWTGAWDSKTGSHLSWLVSGAVTNPTTADLPIWGGSQTHDATTNYVRLAGAGTTDTTVAGNGIIVPLQSITTPTTTGRYGWWVADEGVKARIDLADPSAERVATTTGSPTIPAVAPTDDAKRLSVMVPGRTGGELLATESSPPASNPAYLGDAAYPATGTTSSATANFLRDLGKVVTTNQVELLGTGVTRSFRQRRFHDFTVSSRGVLADVAAGGLKKDLTAAFLGTATEQAKLPDATPLFTIPTTATVTQPNVLPSWGALRSYVQLQNRLEGASPSIAPRPTTDSQMGIYPIVQRFQLWRHPAVESDQSIRQLFFPAVVLWNPYDVTLAATIYTGMYAEAGKNTLAATIGTGAVKTGSDDFGSDIRLEPVPGEVLGELVRGASKGFLIECPALAPGEAIVFTPKANADYLSSTPATLAPGWRTYFWYQTVTTNPASAASDEVDSLSLIPNNGTANAGFRLHLGSGVRGLRNIPTGACLQRIEGLQWRARTRPKPPPATGEEAIPISIASLDPTPPGLFTGDPTMGFNSALKMSYQPNITGASQADGTKPVAWLGQYNPASSYMGRSGTYNWTDNYNHAARSEIASQFPVQCDGQNAYVGYSADDARSPTRAQLFHLPRSETGSLSLGALQHAQVHPSSGLGQVYNPARMPAYAVGNSYVDPLVLCSDSDGFPNWDTTVSGNFFKFHCDLSFVLNRTLWDKYYFSAVPASGPPSFPLPNPRHTLHDPKNVGAAGLASSLQNVDTAAAHLLVEGAFNINSTSREAWRALLASTRKAPVVKQDGDTAVAASSQHTPLARGSYPLEGAVDGTTTLSADKSQAYNGFRSLTDPQLDALAIQIVQQVKARAADGNYGPCRSLADFVNRRPTAITQAYQLKGPLQAAIDATTLNGTSGDISSTRTPMITTVGTGLNEIRYGGHFLYGMVQPGYSETQCRFQYASVPLAAAIPGYLTQADLLQLLGPVFSARSDTFRIRTYGDASDPTSSTTVRARAWCEAIVQRVPEYVDAQLPAETDLASVTSPTKDFGRRFQVVSFRWLSPSEL